MSSSSLRCWVVRAAIAGAVLFLGTSAARAVITITEIMYHPPGGGSDLEYIEIHNETPDPMDITGYFFSNGVKFTFTDRTFLDPGAYLVVCANQELVKSTYGITNAVGDWDADASLDNAGEAIELANPAGVVEARVRYNDRGKWPSGADGTGHSLELRYVYSEMDDPDHWALSTQMGGSPGKPNGAEPAVPPILINEASLLPTSGERWVELFNRGDAEFDLSGYHLTTQRDDLTKGTIPQGTMIPSRGWVSFSDASLALDLTPDVSQRVFLALAAPDGSRVIDARIFEPTAGGLTEARIPDGDRYFSEAAEPTRDGPNRVEVIHDIVINEVMYHPLGNDPAGEFVELYNRGTLPVELAGWTFSDGIRFEIPAGTSLSPAEFLVIAPYPEGIRETYELPAAKVLGPADEEGRTQFGVLADGGERITLLDARGNIADTVRYYDGGEWPEWADGGGSSMELIDPFQDNSNPQAWDASDDSANSPVTEYSYDGVFTGAEPEFHLLLTGPGMTLVDDLKMCTAITGAEATETYVKADDVLKYFKGTAEPSDPVSLWREIDFDDASWFSGPAIIGFGDGDEATVLDDMRGLYISFYVRRKFTVADPTTVESLILDIEYDDGYVAYLNGSEVASGNMRPDARAHDAAATVQKEKVKELVDLTEKKPLLVAGTNVLAIQVHNASLTSNDARFRASLMNGRFVVTEGPNLIKDGAFDTDAYKPFWTIQGNHVRSGRTAKDPLSGAGSLKIVATGDGDNKVNRIETSNTGLTTPAMRVNYRISFLARWLVGSPTILTHGAYANSVQPAYAASTRLRLPDRLGTPGAPNSVTLRQIERTGSSNMGPVISRIQQTPTLPAANQPVVIAAMVHDPDGVKEVNLHYSLDTPRAIGDAALFTVPMTDPDGDGNFSAQIPGQAARKRVVFFIEAADAGDRRGRYPLNYVGRSNPLLLNPEAPTVNDHRYAIYRPDTAVGGRLHSYRFWLHAANESYLSTRPLLSNDMVPGTFLFQGRDIYHNAETRFSGSPFARQAWTESYRVRLPEDQPLHGSIESFNMEDHQGAGARDGRERISHYLIRYNQGQSRVPYSLQWLVQFQVNDRVNEVREHVQTPNVELIERWYPGDDDGDFFEMDDRHVINDAGGRQDSQDGRLLYPPYGAATLGPDKEMYRYYFNPRMREDLDDFTTLIEFAKLMTQSVTPNDQFDKAVWDAVDVECLCRVWAVRLNTDDWDQWSGSRGKNCYLYRPRNDGRWVLIPWDMELTYATAGTFMPPALTATSNPTYSSAFTEVTRFLNRPRIKRVFYGVMKEMIDHQFRSAFLTPFLLKLDAIGVQNTAVGKSGGYIDTRRNALINIVKGVTSPAVQFAVTTNGGAPMSVESPAVTIEGRAPVEITSILAAVNGDDKIPFDVHFSDTSVVGWIATGTLPSGPNAIEFLGFNTQGDLIASAQIDVEVTIPAPPSIDAVVPARAVEGEVVIITGSGFRSGLEVFFGSLEAAETLFEPAVDPARIEAKIPAGLPLGPVDVVIENPGGQRSAPATIQIIASKRKFLRGDVDLDLELSLTDAVVTLRFLFQGGLTLTCLDAADTDDDGEVSLTDAVVTLLFLFQGGSPPAPPHPTIGEDPTTSDPLDCGIGLE